MYKITKSCVLRAFSDRPTDRQTDRPTNRPTDRAAYRVACTQLKKEKKLLIKKIEKGNESAKGSSFGFSKENLVCGQL